MQVVDEFEGYYWQGGSIVRKCMWGWSCETGGKIKIPLWPAVNLRLLTAQRSCCVTGFLMTLQQPFATNGFELIYFSFYKHPPSPPPSTPSQPTQRCSSFFLPTSPSNHSVSFSIFLSLCYQRHTYILCPHGMLSPFQHHASGREHLSLGPPCHTVLGSG